MKLTFETAIAFGLLCASISAKGQSQPAVERVEDSKDIVTIEFLKNIEFLGYVLHIGEPEDEPSQSAANHPLRLALDEKRHKLKNEESITKIFELGEALPYSLFVKLFTKMDELPHHGKYKIPAGIMQDHHLNAPADVALIQEIMEQVDVFYKLSEFDLFWKTHQEWYEKARAEINKIRPDHELIEGLENFYGQKFSSYKIIPSLTFWSGPGFGFKDGKSTAFFILGPFTDDFQFNDADRLKTLAIHEFGHSFANDILETTCSDIIEETRPLFDTIAGSMYPQGYHNWSSCVNEHFVRAGEVLVAELLNNQALSQSNLKWNTEERKFIYLPCIVDRLRKYRIAEELSYGQSVRKIMEDLKERFMP